jgi:K+-sensing histidine kinase KdpD
MRGSNAAARKDRAENVTIGELLDRILPRLKQRADDCGMEVRVHATERTAKRNCTSTRRRWSRFLFNLVDNACKYAAPRAAEPVIHVEADTSGKFAMLRVRDHGGGISRSERRRIFHPFHKSADQAAHSAPGVGLGSRCAAAGDSARRCDHAGCGAQGRRVLCAATARLLEG